MDMVVIQSANGNLFFHEFMEGYTYRCTYCSSGSRNTIKLIIIIGGLEAAGKTDSLLIFWIDILCLVLPPSIYCCYTVFSQLFVGHISYHRKSSNFIL